MSEVVILGADAHEFTLVAQPHSRLKHGITRIVKGLPALGLDLADLAKLTDVDGLTAVVETLGAAADTIIYDVLCLLVPSFKNRMPLYEFLGYASEEARQADDYDPDKAVDPTTPQIVAAIKAGIKVNDLGNLGKLLGQAQSLPSGISPN